MPDRGIRSAFKTPTTPNVTEGITKAIEGAISKCGIPLDAVAAVMIGTTVSLELETSFLPVAESSRSQRLITILKHFINAVVQADDRNLKKVAVLRVCGPYTKENPAFMDFPPILSRIMNGHVGYLDGGLECQTPLSCDPARELC